MRHSDHRAKAVVRAFTKQKPTRLGPMTGKEFQALVARIIKSKGAAA